MKIKNALLIAGIAAMLLAVAIGIDETQRTLAIAFPFCLFTIAGGTILVITSGKTIIQVVGIAMMVSPIWMIPAVNFIINTILGVF